jgi:hypothetical protein
MKKILFTIMLIAGAAGGAKAETVMIDFNGNSGAIYAEDLADGQEVVKTTAAVAGVKAAAAGKAGASELSAGSASAVSKPQSAAAILPAAASAAGPLPAVSVAKPAAGAVKTAKERA